MLFVYNAITVLGGIILSPAIFLWLLLSTKRRQTFFRRLGWDPNPLPAPRGSNSRPLPTIWIHALSVGEVLSAVPLVAALARDADGHRLVFTASTKTGYEIAHRRLGDRVSAVVYFPYDLVCAVNRRMRQINPAAIIIVETDIWPNFLHAANKRKIPLILVNARLSDRSYDGYRRLRTLFTPALRSFRRIGAQTNRDRERFISLGVAAERVHRTGNIKFDPPSLLHPPISRREFERSMGLPDRCCLLLAGSIHPEEETLLRDAFEYIKAACPAAALIVAPRDPRRAEKIIRLFASAGRTVRSLRSHDTVNDGATEIIVVDKMGVLRELYSVCDVAFIGGSLCPAGGHNPLEPAEFARPVLFGPDMRDFREIAALLIAADGAQTVADARELANAVTGLFQAPPRAEQMGRRAREVFTRNQGALERTLDIVRQHAIMNP